MTTTDDTVDPQTEAANLRAKATKLAKEALEIRDRMEKDGKTDQLQERFDNLSRGAQRATEQADAAEAKWATDMLERYKAGQFTVENGDESRAPFPGTAGATFLSPLVEGIKAARFDLKSNPSVSFDGYKVLKSTFPAESAFPSKPGAMVPLAKDNRWLFPLMPTESAGTALTVQDFKQTARTVTGTIQRTQTATTDKATLDVTLASVVEAIPQHAIIVDEIPNAMFNQFGQLSSFLAGEASFEIYKSIDAHVRAQILAATPPNGLTGINLVEQIRQGVKEHRAFGANPTIVAVSPDDAATLDTLQTSDGAFLFGTSGTNNGSPMWNLRVVEWIGDDDAPPLLIDPQMLGVFYVGRMAFDANPYTGFKKNLTDLRIETSALFHVRNANGAFVIEAD